MGKYQQNLIDKICDLKKERNAIILAHNYQIDEVQDIADYVGDSFELSQIAAKTDAKIIVFCGVHFMAESAAILASEKIVLLPEKLAGCPMADMITVDALRKAKKNYPDALVATYVNSSAAVKAESDICVTSSNAVEVVKSLDADTVLFTPDRNLGSYIQKHTSKNIILWNGYCATHHRVTPEDVKKAREHHPNAVIVVHPECRPEVVEMADMVQSTGGILRYARETSAKEILVGTEMGLLHRLRKENPDKKFYLLSSALICPNMKYTNLEKIAYSLEHMKHHIVVPEKIAFRARRALERMLQVPSKN